MIKKKNIIVAMFVLTLFLVSALFYGNSVERIEYQAIAKTFRDADDLLAHNDLVIIAEATENSESTLLGDSTPDIWGYTLTEVKVLNVIKGALEGADLTVGEPYFTADPGLVLPKQLITYETYTPMKEGSRYLLFLKWHPGWECYAVNGFDQGKYNIDNTDREELAMVKSKHRHQLRREVLERYQPVVEEFIKDSN